MVMEQKTFGGNIVKKLCFLSFVFLLAACSGNDDTQNMGTEKQDQTTPVTSQTSNSNEGSNKEEQNPNSINNLTYPEDTEEILEIIDEMSQWESFYSTFMYMEYSDIGTNLLTESSVITKYIMNPAEAFIEHHRIGFSNQMVDFYANETDGFFENQNMNGWMPMEEPNGSLVNIIPARMEMLKTLIANAEEFYKMGGADYPEGGWFNVRPEALEESYLKLLKTFFMNAIESEVDPEHLEVLYSEPMEFTMISVTIEQYEERIGQYTIQVFFMNPDTGEEQEYNFFEMFEYINELNIDLPEELQQLLA